MIVDCFTFAGEHDLLEHRLDLLSDRVDWFVIVEAPLTFQGARKRLTFQDEHQRYERWRHKIVYVIASLPETEDPWQREAAQREAMSVGVNALHLAADDLIVVSDVDEIWNPTVDLSLNEGPLLVLLLDHFVWSKEWMHPEPWPGPVVCTKRTLDSCGDNPFSTLRSCRLHDRPTKREHAGRHLSWFGGLEAAQHKLGSFSHTELADVDLERLRADGRHVDGTPLVAV